MTTEGDHLRSYLNQIKRPWEDPTSQTTRVSFAHGLRLVDGVYLTDSVTGYGDILAALQADDGALQTVQVTRTVVETQEIGYDTLTQEDPDMDFGKSETIQAGVPGSQTVTHRLLYENGVLIDDRVVAVEVQQAPTPEIIRRGTRLKSGMIGKLGTGTFIWPVPGLPQHQPLGRPEPQYSRPPPRRGHHRPRGNAPSTLRTPAPWWKSSPCTTAGGNYVKIDHGNGYATLYAHMSRYVVSVGDTVSQGQVIGYVGSTGDSTGNHCHFEMAYNDVLFSARDVFPDMPIKNTG